MRTIIAGGRDVTHMLYLHEALAKCGWLPTVVICGMARGADMLGHEWATNTSTPIEEYYADWEKFGRKAGHIRNAEMRDAAEALIALWDGHSKGTANMINIAKAKGLRTYVQLV